ncbi:MAG TPA: c-type cytochrome [Terriglobales bacterium]|nr:c-type cytochrome [Terriglobales bacterium]
MLAAQTNSHWILSLALLASWVSVFDPTPSLAQQNQQRTIESRPDQGTGQSTYNSNCARCHGLDGHGGDKGVDIAGEQGQRLSDSKLFAVVSKGLTGTAMPAFPELSRQQILSVIHYLRILQGKEEARNVPGDASRGKTVFFGKAGCSNCHTICGEGGFLGPDLSSYGLAASAKSIREEIIKPNRVEPTGYRSATVTMQDGTQLEGLLRNEDNFSLQLLTRDGGFHFYTKSDLRNLEYRGRSFMPTDYADRLSSSELDDLVSYIIRSASKASPTTSPNGEPH